MKVTLENVRPTVWRRLLVPAGFTLRQLHRVLLATMGWHDSHLHQFIIRGNYYGKTDREFGFARRDERLHNLEHLLALGIRGFRYEYDFGDGWMHRIAIEKVEEADGRPLEPVCLAGKRACPPEDSGAPGATPSCSTCSVTPLTRITRTRRPGPVLASTPSASTSTASTACLRRFADQPLIRAFGGWRDNAHPSSSRNRSTVSSMSSRMPSNVPGRIARPECIGITTRAPSASRR